MGKMHRLFKGNKENNQPTSSSSSPSSSSSSSSSSLTALDKEFMAVLKEMDLDHDAMQAALTLDIHGRKDMINRWQKKQNTNYKSNMNNMQPTSKHKRPSLADLDFNHYQSSPNITVNDKQSNQTIISQLTHDHLAKQDNKLLTTNNPDHTIIISKRSSSILGPNSNLKNSFNAVLVSFSIYDCMFLNISTFCINKLGCYEYQRPV